MKQMIKNNNKMNEEEGKKENNIRREQKMKGIGEEEKRFCNEVCSDRAIRRGSSINRFQ